MYIVSKLGGCLRWTSVREDVDYGFPIQFYLSNNCFIEELKVRPVFDGDRLFKVVTDTTSSARGWSFVICSKRSGGEALNHKVLWFGF